MMCTCPKCHATIELDLPEVTEAGTTASCPACNARFSVHRESFGGRALRKSGEISCAACGSELGSQTHCAACGAQFPDYLVVTLGRRRARRDSKKLKLKTSPFPQAPKSSTQLPSLDMSLRPEAATPLPGKKLAGSKTSNIAVTALVLVALIGTGVFFYLKNEAEKTYAKNFVLATYCVQTGVDKALKSNTRIAAEWKLKADAGQPYVARPSLDDERDFGIISGKISALSQKLTKAPKKFASCGEKLDKLQAVFTKVHALAQAPGSSLQALSDSSAKLDAEYKVAVKEYKSGMPDEIMDELVSASQRFKGLRPLLR
jgi:DNA-directed RNA polymerase subunit RPC12/RpoP